MHVYVAGARNRQIDELLHTGGVRTTPCEIDALFGLATQPSMPADVVVLDLRDRSAVPASIAVLKRNHPQLGIVIIASSLDPVLMLEAMRAGVTEFVTEPVTQTELIAAVDRVAARQAARDPGQVVAFLGGKGGVGTTTLAINVATAFAARSVGSSTLLVDLHVSSGDAALFVGAEPRFSVADALENIQRLDDTFLRTLVGRTNYGLDLLASSERPMAGPVDIRAVRSLIDCAARNYSQVVLDVPRADPTMLDALELVTNIVVVANQELSTLRGASRMAAALRQRYGKDRVSVVVSRYDHVAEIGKKEIERVMGGPVAQVFPSDYRLALNALNVGRPLVLDNHSKLAASFASFARGLNTEQADEPKDRDRTSGGLFSRFTSRA
jgi:pilus assembly protein CpaE